MLCMLVPEQATCEARNSPLVQRQLDSCRPASGATVIRVEVKVQGNVDDFDLDVGRGVGIFSTTRRTCFSCTS